MVVYVRQGFGVSPAINYRMKCGNAKPVMVLALWDTKLMERHEGGPICGGIHSRNCAYNSENVFLDKQGPPIVDRYEGCQVNGRQ